MKFDIIEWVLSIKTMLFSLSGDCDCQLRNMQLMIQFSTRSVHELWNILVEFLPRNLVAKPCLIAIQTVSYLCLPQKLKIKEVRSEINNKGIERVK